MNQCDTGILCMPTMSLIGRQSIILNIKTMQSDTKLESIRNTGHHSPTQNVKIANDSHSLMLMQDSNS